MYKRYQHIHLVGIGGIGMSGIAELLLNQGYTVSGSDLKSSPIVERLTGLGGRISIGHDRGNIQGADVVVISSAVGPDNPEVTAAKEAKIPVIPRAEMLAELMRLKYGLAVAGAHGKTTASTMLGAVLARGGLDPTLIVGGRLSALGSSNARLGDGEFLVAEADESDGSFMSLSPTIAVVTNIDAEHLDFYRDVDHIRQTFLDFLNKVPFYGLDVICLDDPHLQSLIPLLTKRYTTYGFSAQAQIQAVDIAVQGMSMSFQVLHQGQPLGQVDLPVPGRHNVLNALAAVGVGLELEIGFQAIAQGLAEMGRIERRFQIRGRKEGVTVLDDYAHHPTEIKATLATLRDCWPGRRLVVVFQPHRHTRTDTLIDQFATAFYGADDLFVLPIYSAGEKPGRLTSGDLVHHIAEHGHRSVQAVGSQEEAVEILNKTLGQDDVLATLGAGDVWQVGQAFLGLEAE
ncbi:MAG: UDP-N-acetylmuramate--L-alanine ligase [Deltaproteobacteria bacterium]|nr:UDP-N-acetylmuramate--L-alanine ligase [Deltaproteobacteria bacterium]